jgi:pimeloyl-ACP methyl ester carboxylesterase
MSKIEEIRTFTRRQIMQGAGALAAYSAIAPRLAEAVEPGAANTEVLYGQRTLPVGIRSRRVDNNNGLNMHILEAGFEGPRRPCLVLLHGFPELAYTWRHQLLPLANAGFHVIAPDLRGYGRSAAAAVTFEDDLLPYACLNRVSDVLGLTRALGHENVTAVIGHDWGAPIAQWCALVRPDVFQSVVSMSNPFYASPSLPFDTANHPRTPVPNVDIHKELAALPRPRRHYLWYCASRDANEDMWHAPQGVPDLLRALYHFKSADWKGNKPHPLKSWTAVELAKMPSYYIMDLHKGIAETMAEEMPSKTEIAACQWMTNADLQVYSTEFIRTGFQGGLNSYRVFAAPNYSTELNILSGRKIEVPSCYIGGESDWGVYQSPGAFEAIQTVCSRLMGVHLVEGAGHSISEEKPEEVNKILSDFLGRVRVG